MTQTFELWLGKDTFLDINNQGMLLQYLKSHLKMLQVRVSTVTIDQNVVKENEDELMKVLVKDVIHQGLEC